MAQQSATDAHAWPRCSRRRAVPVTQPVGSGARLEIGPRSPLLSTGRAPTTRRHEGASGYSRSCLAVAFAAGSVSVPSRSGATVATSFAGVRWSTGSGFASVAPMHSGVQGMIGQMSRRGRAALLTAAGIGREGGQPLGQRRRGRGRRPSHARRYRPCEPEPRDRHTRAHCARRLHFDASPQEERRKLGEAERWNAKAPSRRARACVCGDARSRAREGCLMTQLVVKISLDPSHAERRSCGPPLATMPILSAPRASRTRELALLRNRAPSSSERNGEAARRAPGRSENAWYQGEEHHRRCTVHATSPASLDSAALSRRLSQLAGSEREVQVEFLLHLSEYDLRRAWLESGFGSLWDFLTRALYYREGAAHRRIRTMRVLRRFPHLAEALRDGRLCLTTAALLEPVLTEENAADLVARAAFKSKAEVEHLVVSLQPRSAPKDGIRKLPERREAPTAAPLLLAAPAPNTAPGTPSAALDAPGPARAPEARPTIRPVAADSYSVNVKIDAELKRELDQL